MRWRATNSITTQSSWSAPVCHCDFVLKSDPRLRWILIITPQGPQPSTVLVLTEALRWGINVPFFQLNIKMFNRLEFQNVVVAFFKSIQDIQKLRSAKSHAFESFLSASRTLGHMTCHYDGPHAHHRRRKASVFGISDHQMWEYEFTHFSSSIFWPSTVPAQFSFHCFPSHEATLPIFGLQHDDY